jgi:thioester reductase-like protein
MFMIASERGIPCNIFRLGLVWSDSHEGRYDELQREYRLLKSCLISGVGIEKYRFDMTPTPVDYVASAIALLANRHPNGHGVFHISSTAQTIEGIFERCNEIAGTSLYLLPIDQWIEHMKRLHDAGLSLPIMPLLGFYEHKQGAPLAGVHFDCKETHGELEHAGIKTPIFSDELLMACLVRMQSRDTDVRAAVVSRHQLAKRYGS